LKHHQNGGDHADVLVLFSLRRKHRLLPVPAEGKIPRPARSNS